MGDKVNSRGLFRGFANEGLVKRKMCCLWFKVKIKKRKLKFDGRTENRGIKKSYMSDYLHWMVSGGILFRMF